MTYATYYERKIRHIPKTVNGELVLVSELQPETSWELWTCDKCHTSIELKHQDEDITGLEECPHCMEPIAYTRKKNYENSWGNTHLKR